MPPALHLSGKRSGQPLVATGAAGRSLGRLFYIRDRTSGVSFLVDTGAEVSVLPPSGPPSSRRPTGFDLRAANNSAIATFGTRSLTLNLGLRRTFRWIFVVADVKNPILGADFLRHYNLLVDVGRNRLLDMLTQLQVQGIVSHDPTPSTSPCPHHPFWTTRPLSGPLCAMTFVHAFTGGGVLWRMTLTCLLLIAYCMLHVYV